MIRSALFLLWFAVVSTVLSLVFCPVLILPRRACVLLARNWARATLWGLKVIAGIDMRVEGTPPRSGVLVASKHMSMWDTLALYLLLDDPAIVLKRELLYIPFYGWFLWKATAIAIDRDAGPSAIRTMTKAAKAVIASGRPILIFPEGTRKKPGAPPDYKPGVAAIYGLLGAPCVPVALNSGRYWQAVRKIPGTITLAFLEPIPPGLKRGPFMQILENRIETATNRLLSA
jgi:1-acyl-sn-glycerol-3-phosphate acyltransferase